MALEWFWTSRFQRDFQDASVGIQRLAHQELRHLDREWQANYGLLRRDTIEGLKKSSQLSNVRELELGGAARLLAQVENGKATLLRLGSHQVVEKFKRSNPTASKVLADREPVARSFWRSMDSFFPDAHGDRPGQVTLSSGEFSPDWAYYLDDEQSAIFDLLVNVVEASLLEQQGRILWLNGGPGTGKTVILLQLLLRLTCSLRESRETWNAGLSMSGRLAEQIRLASGLDPSVPISRFQDFAGSENGRLDFLLVDDPMHVATIERYSALAKQGRLDVLIVAFDPLQLATPLSDQEFDELRRSTGAESVVLKRCYRQKQAIGDVVRKSLTAVAQSSPFLDEGKKKAYKEQRKSLTRMSNDLEYPNPSGFARTYEQDEATLVQWVGHLSWLIQQGIRQRPWERLAVVMEAEARLSDAWVREAERLGIPLEEFELDDPDLKGLEFAHVAIFMNQGRYRDATEGFTGSGRRMYDHYRLLRIPFSRARDSLTVWVMSDDD